MCKEVTECIRMMSHQIKNTNIEKEIAVNKTETKTEILEFIIKSLITKMKISLERLNSSLEQVEERIIKYKNRSVEIIKSKQQKEKQ